MMRMKAINVLALVILVANGAFAQDKQKRDYGATPEDSIECVKALSLYGEFYKQENYEDAMAGWKQALAICPGSSKNLYIRGNKMMNHFIKQNEGEGQEARKEMYVDTLLLLYDMRIENFGEEGKVLAMKGVDMMKHRKKDPAAAYEVLSKAFELQGNKFSPSGVVYMFLAKYYMVAKKMSDKKELIELYPKLADVVSYNEKNNEKYAKLYTQAGGNLLKYFEKVATCDDLIGLYEPTFEEMKTDAEHLKKVLDLFDKRKCTERELYLKSAVALNEIEPSSEAAYGIAISMLKKERYNEAIDFFTKSIELREDNSENFDAYINKAKALLIQKRYQEARNSAAQAKAINPNSGEAYIIMGDAYGYGAKSCFDDACKAKAGWWLAYDYYAKAKSVDASIADKAGKKMGQASSQFPKTEDCFFHGLTDGQSFTFESCWVTETTTVRVNK